MKRFGKPQESDAFKQWMSDHPDGYYLNDRGEELPMLHRVGCIHLDDGEGYIATTNAKTAFDSLADLDIWKRESKPFVPCSTCMKGSRGR